MHTNIHNTSNIEITSVTVKDTVSDFIKIIAAEETLTEKLRN